LVLRGLRAVPAQPTVAVHTRSDHRWRDRWSQLCRDHRAKQRPEDVGIANNPNVGAASAGAETSSSFVVA
jgi:hypothetical protein